MKRILFGLTILALVLPAIRKAEAEVDVSIDFFYDNVGSDGNWVEVADYGYCWQPNIAASNSKWRPYSDGYWAYTDVGWTWVSYEDFGWATYHYGRWTRLRDRGWFWVPGREWGPAWVSWRTGGDYVGWAPLPPRGHGDFDDNRPINGQVDVDFDIGPDYYNFVDVRFIGEPVLRERIVEPRMNITYISHTVNVTNITYTNSVVYNHGPDYNAMSRYSTRPIRRMTLERDANVDLSVAVKSNGLTRVQGDKIIVAAPMTFQKPPKPIAPKVFKEKIAKPTFERGWKDSDPKAQAELKEKMKKEDPKTVAPPSFTPNANVAPAGTAIPAAASPAPSTNPAATAAPAPAASPVQAPDKDKGKDKDKRPENASPMPTAAVPAMTPPGRPKKERGEKPAPAVSPSSATVPGTSPGPTRNKPYDRQPSSPSSLTTSPDGTPFREPAVRPVEPKKDKHAEKVPDTMPPTIQPIVPPTEKVPRKPKDLPTAAPNREALPDASHKQPKTDVPAESLAPPKREAPPERPRKQPPVEAPKERIAPPPGPGANEPVKPEAPHSKQRPDKKTNEPAPSPTS